MSDSIQDVWFIYFKCECIKFLSFEFALCRIHGMLEQRVKSGIECPRSLVSISRARSSARKCSTRNPLFAFEGMGDVPCKIRMGTWW